MFIPKKHRINFTLRDTEFTIARGLKIMYLRIMKDYEYHYIKCKLDDEINELFAIAYVGSACTNNKNDNYVKLTRAIIRKSK